MSPHGRRKAELLWAAELEPPPDVYGLASAYRSHFVVVGWRPSVGLTRP